MTEIWIMAAVETAFFICVALLVFVGLRRLGPEEEIE